MLENPMVSGYGCNYSTDGRLFFKGFEEDWVHEVEEESVKCEECGEELHPEEAHESLIWEDTYICNEKKCIDSHYTGETENVFYKNQY